ncbi:hypothetical protein ACFO3J_31045 [Streptomyces polygonati]|uniref:Uncharacterized protein n=1 Tax=Streptomyces polygonati TaxID=1617087 RepID=A0ABV8HY77_9ACTN
MTPTLEALRMRGFEGLVPFAGLEAAEIPSDGGTCAVVRTSDAAPAFTATSTAGWREKRDPAVGVERLAEKRVEGAEALCIGKAETATAGSHALRGRLRQYARHGLGGTSHHGGRYVWQSTDHASLLIAWKPGAHLRDAEKALMGEFETLYGALPFAHLAH